MRFQSFLILATSFAILSWATPIPSLNDGSSDTNNQNLSNAEPTTAPLSSSTPIVKDRSQKNLGGRPKHILTDRDRNAIHKWKEGLQGYNWTQHQKGATRAREQAVREGKNPNDAEDAYYWKRMNGSLSKARRKNRERLGRGRPNIEIDPKKIAAWKAELEKDDKKLRLHMKGLERVMQEAKENKDNVDEVVDRYNHAQFLRARRRKMEKESKKEKGETNLDIKELTTTTQPRPGVQTQHEEMGTNLELSVFAGATTTAPHPQNAYPHLEPEDKGDISFTFDLGTDSD